MEEIRCGERLSPVVGSRADSGAVILTCFPVQRTLPSLSMAEAAQGGCLIGTSQGSSELAGSHVS